jgi:hypothetical protein
MGFRGHVFQTTSIAVYLDGPCCSVAPQGGTAARRRDAVPQRCGLGAAAWRRDTHATEPCVLRVGF